MPKRLRLLVAPPLATGLLVLFASTALAASEVIVYPNGALVSPTQAYLAARVTCSPDELRPDLFIGLQQPTGAGSGDAGVIACDNQPHYYAIAVTATNGTFQSGPANATVNWSFVTCTRTPGRPPNCVGNESVRHQTVTLFALPPPNQD